MSDAKKDLEPGHVSPTIDVKTKGDNAAVHVAYLPLVFQVVTDDDTHRFCELLALPASNKGCSRSLDTVNEIGNSLNCFVKSNDSLKDSVPLVIVLNAHGREGTGELKNITIDDVAQLVSTLPEWKAGMYVVCAQCFGDVFADALRLRIQNREDVQIHCTAEGPTESSYSFRSVDEVTIGDFKHYHLGVWFLQTFPPPRQAHIDAKQGSGMGAHMQLATNNVVKVMWEFLQNKYN
eukprot:m.133853 g.133853  ORF g.133853 m.133853 type:complete len:235 (-) comp9494_c3_seq4:762-1466(-)